LKGVNKIILCLKVGVRLWFQEKNKKASNSVKKRQKFENNKQSLTKVFFKNFLMYNSSSRVFFLQEMTVVFRERKRQKFFKKKRRAYFKVTYFLRMGKDFEG
jgi:CMP-N-acetylneuraminic acid synthetase